MIDASFMASAAFWSSDTRAFTISAAHQLPDFIRGADAVDAIAVGVRFMQATPASIRVERMRPTVLVSATPEMDTLRVVRVRSPGAQRVEIRGDFTDWQPVELKPTGTTFNGRVALARGSHHMVVRIDGGPWRPAVNTPDVDDDLGGRAGLLVVP